MKILATLAVLLTTLTLGCSSSGTNDAAKQPSMDEMMAAMTRAGTVGDAHRKLDAFVGTWNAKLKMWMDPAAPAEESTGVMTNAWTLDGHYLEQKFQGNFGGHPFSGVSLWGYDVAGGKYVGIWVDSMSTAISVATGQASADGKSFTMHMVNTDPMTGKPAHGEELITIDSANQHTMTMYELRGDEKIKTMEIVYTRA